MKIKVRPNNAEAWQITHDRGWWDTFLWLVQHNIDAKMVVTVQRPEEDHFVIYCREGPVSAYTGDWVVTMDGAVGVYSDELFDKLFEIEEA